MSEQNDLFQRLRNFIQWETETQKSTLLRQWEKPLAERVYQGKAIEGLKVDGVGKDDTVRLSCQTNNSRFREGDILVLHRGDPQGIEAVQGYIERDDETVIEVSLQRGNPFYLQTTPEGWLADEGMLNLSPFYQDALEEVADSVRGREIILPLLNGSRTPMLDIARCERAQKAGLEKGLDESQALAVAQAYGTDLYHLIQGPPGTGKTVVLGHLVSMFVEEGQRVLVTGLTHRAINNALNKIFDIDPDLPVCKIGIESRGQDLRFPNYENFRSSGLGDLSDGYAIGATPFATRGGRLSHVEFDIVLFDEASQITLPLAIMGMLAGKKYIFIGDEHQLPPIVVSRAVQREHASIFGYLCGRGNETMLTTTYRMNNILTAWPSKTFYNGQIQSDPEVAERRLKLDDKSTEWDHVLDPDNPLVFIDVGQFNNTIRSQKDAEIVCELIESLIFRGVQSKDIGVVVPYRAQGRLIRNLLRRVLPEDQFREIVVDTVERMQGQEREVILLSLTTSSSRFAADLAEFFFQPERLNVSITRPRTKLIIIGSRHVLDAKPSDPQHQEWVEIFRDLLNTCTTYTL
jgi:DNA replication ATP-dependent helicase Dna2